jgi:hypothetical protein
MTSVNCKNNICTNDCPQKWDSNINYNKCDVVLHNNCIYVALKNNKCIEPNKDSCKTCKLVSECCNETSFSFKGSWKCNRNYNKNDFVTHNGSSYVATLDIPKEKNNILNNYLWRVIARGISYKSTWKPNTKYLENCLVKYKENIYICICSHTNCIPPDESDCWELLSMKAKDGKCPRVFELCSKGEWSCSEYYQKNNIVRRNNCVYVACESNKNKDPKYYDNIWSLLVKDGKNGNGANDAVIQIPKLNIKYSGEWKNNINYCKNNIVRHNNSTYISSNDNRNKEPDKNKYCWHLIARDGINGTNGTNGRDCLCDRSQNEKCDHDETKAKFIYATLVNAKNMKDECKQYLDDSGNVIIKLNEYLVELRFNSTKYNSLYFVVNNKHDNTACIKFKKEGYYKITYNFTYRTSSKFSLYTYFNDNCQIYPGETKGVVTNDRDENVINHTFYLGVGNSDLDKKFKIFYVHKNCEDYTTNSDEVTFYKNRCWLSIEYIGD